MKSKFIQTIGVAFLLFLVFNAKAGELVGTETTSPSGTTKSIYYVGIGDSVQINNSFDSKQIVWSTSDASIIIVNPVGIVIGVNEGLAVVYATANDGSTISKWEVKCFKSNVDSTIDSNVVVDPIVQPDQYYKLLVGEKINIQPSVMIALPYTWTSSNSEIASIDNNGNVVGIKSGESIVALQLANGTTLSKYIIYVGDTTSISDTTVVDPGYSVQYLKLALGEKYTFTNDTNNNLIYVDKIAGIKSSGKYDFVAKYVGENNIIALDVFGNIQEQWIVYVYDTVSTTPIDTNTFIIANPGYQSIYLTLGDTANIYSYLNISPEFLTIDWVSNGIIEPGVGGWFKAIATGYTKCFVHSLDGTKFQEYFVINVFNNSIDKDSIKELKYLSVISASNFQYQNYSKIEIIDSNSIKIVFEKEITDIDEIAKNLNLQFDSIGKQKANAGSLTIKSVKIDPTNNKAIIITTEEVVPETATLALTFNDVLILSSEGNAYNLLDNKIAMASHLLSSNFMNVYPNVATESITVKSENISEIGIYSISGQKIDQINTDNSTVLINVSDYRPGTYIVKLKTSKAQTISKLFIKL